jgi:hypothetical protein
MNQPWMTARRALSWRVSAWALMAIVLAWLGACATTQLKDSWKDPAFTGPPLKHLLVIGAFKGEVNRRIFEDAFVSAFKADGTAAEPSYQTLPEGGAIPNERVQAAVRSTGADAVLVTRLLRVRRDVNVMPSYVAPGFYGAGFRGWYGGAYAMAPADVTVYDVLTIESTLWNMRTDKPVWSGTSEMTAPSSVAKASNELAAVLIAKMKADGVI